MARADFERTFANIWATEFGDPSVVVGRRFISHLKTMVVVGVATGARVHVARRRMTATNHSSAYLFRVLEDRYRLSRARSTSRTPRLATRSSRSRMYSAFTRQSAWSLSTISLDVTGSSRKSLTSSAGSRWSAAGGASIAAWHLDAWRSACSTASERSAFVGGCGHFDSIAAHLATNCRWLRRLAKSRKSRDALAPSAWWTTDDGSYITIQPPACTVRQRSTSS